MTSRTYRNSCVDDWSSVLIAPEMSPPAASCCPPLLWSVLTLRVSTTFLSSCRSFSLSWILCWILLCVSPKCVYVEGIHHITSHKYCIVRCTEQHRVRPGTEILKTRHLQPTIA